MHIVVNNIFFSLSVYSYNLKYLIKNIQVSMNVTYGSVCFKGYLCHPPQGLKKMYGVCHRFRLTKRDDYFKVKFDHF